MELIALEPQLVAAKKDYENILEELEAAYLIHGKLQIVAWGLDQSNQTLFEDIQDLTRELIGLKREMAARRGEKHDDRICT